jgi:spermidine synthase
MFQYIRSFISPVFIEKVSTKVNKEIIIEFYFGRYQIKVGNFIQSGLFTQNILETAFNNINLKKYDINKVLILGLGAGSMIKTINKKFSNCKITGVDLDQKIIEIGKKYFNLSSWGNLDIKVSDAFDYLTRFRNQKFDLIISDLYIGCDTDKILQTRKFVEMIFNHLRSKNGVYISNCSYLQKYRKQSITYLEKVKTVFKNTENIIKRDNLIILGYK